MPILCAPVPVALGLALLPQQTFPHEDVFQPGVDGLGRVNAFTAFTF